MTPTTTNETENTVRKPRVVVSLRLANALKDAMQKANVARAEYELAQQTANEKQRAWHTVGGIADGLVVALIEDAGHSMAAFPKFSIMSDGDQIVIVPTEA